MGEKYPPSPYGRPFDKTTAAYKAFIAKRSFTPDEFACLLADIDPRTFDGSLSANSVKQEKIGAFLRLLEEDLKEVEGYEDVPF